MNKYSAYDASPKSRARHARYDASPEGHAARARYEASPEGHAARARYEASPEGHAARARYEASPEGHAARARYKASPEGRVQRLLYLACKRGLVTISAAELLALYTPECPGFGTPWTVPGNGWRDTDITLDRLDPRRGYEPGNVWFLSRLANNIKSNATHPEQLVAVANAWLRRITP